MARNDPGGNDFGVYVRALEWIAPYLLLTFIPPTQLAIVHRVRRNPHPMYKYIVERLAAEIYCVLRSLDDVVYELLWRNRASEQ